MDSASLPLRGADGGAKPCKACPPSKDGSQTFCRFRLHQARTGLRSYTFFGTTWRVSSLIQLFTVVSSLILGGFLVNTSSNVYSTAGLVYASTWIWMRIVGAAIIKRSDPFQKMTRQPLIETHGVIAVSGAATIWILFITFRQTFAITVMPYMVDGEGNATMVTKVLPPSYVLSGVLTGVVYFLVGMTCFWFVPSIQGVGLAVTVGSGVSILLDVFHAAIMTDSLSSTLMTYIYIRASYTGALAIFILGVAYFGVNLCLRWRPSRLYLRTLGIVEGTKWPIGFLLTFVYILVLLGGALYWLILTLANQGKIAQLLEDQGLSFTKPTDAQSIVIIAATAGLLEVHYFFLGIRWFRMVRITLAHLCDDTGKYRAQPLPQNTNVASSLFPNRVATSYRQFILLCVIGAVKVIILFIVALAWWRSTSEYMVTYFDGSGYILIAVVTAAFTILAPRYERGDWQMCKEFKRCTRFLEILNIDSELLDPDHNRCFCVHCMAKGASLQIPHAVTYRRGKPDQLYTLPLGWCRFGVKVDESFAAAHKIYTEWNVCYHGTSWNAVKSILEHHQLLLPGDTLLDGRKLAIREGHLDDQIYVYTTPTVNYAALNYYASPVPFESSSVRVVLQCLQFPSSFEVGPETTGWRRAHPDGQRVDEWIPDTELEWFTNRRVAVVVTGILVRFDDVVAGVQRGDFDVSQSSETASSWAPEQAPVQTIPFQQYWSTGTDSQYYHTAEVELEHVTTH